MLTVNPRGNAPKIPWYDVTAHTTPEKAGSTSTDEQTSTDELLISLQSPGQRVLIWPLQEGEVPAVSSYIGSKDRESH